MQTSVAAHRPERAEKPSEKLGKSPEILEAMRLLKLAAEPRPAGDSVKGAIRRAAGHVRIKESRAEDIWYGEVHLITSREMDALRAFERKQSRRSLEARYREHIEQAFALRGRLQSRDPEMHKPDIDMLSFFINELQSALNR